MIKFSHKILPLVAVVVAFLSCNDTTLQMSTTFANTNTYAEYTNQTEIELSTFRLDSVQTSSQNVVWVGRHTKPVIGDVCSESVMRMAEPSYYEWAEKEKYDSVCMVLRHTGEYQGDTMQWLKVDVHQMAQPVEFAENESSFYNVRTFRDSISIGKFGFTPRPHSRPRVRFRLSDEFGQSLVNFIKQNENYASAIRQQNFRSFLGGIKVTSEDAKNLLAFSADSCKIELHSHVPMMDQVHKIRELNIYSSAQQYNYVWTENPDSPYETLNSRTKQVTEDEGGQHSVLFEGLGYYTRINFPTLEYIQTTYQYAHIVKAVLKLYPERDSYDKHNFPSNIYFSTINRDNVLQGNVVTQSGTRVVGTLVNNILDENEVYYLADLTYYINTILSQDNIDDGDGIVVTWGTSMVPTDYNFMVFNGHGKDKYYSELQLYYYYYDKEDR